MYETVIDQLDPEEWDRLCTTFPGMSIYQTGSYGELHSTGIFRSCSRIAVFKGNQIVSAAQVRIKKIPFLSAGVAEIDWGPLFQTHEEGLDQEALGRLLAAIRSEYCEIRKLQVRIRPRHLMSQMMNVQLHDLLTQHGYRKNTEARPYYTVVIDLDKPLDAIRASFHQKWRNQLNVAERAGLKCECGNSIEYFDRFYAIYKAMWLEKKFPTGVRLPIIREMQHQLPPHEKFLVTILGDGKTDIGATVCAAFGNTLLYFLGATTPGMRSDSRPGYLLQWLHIQKAKELGFRWYDLGGYDDNSLNIARFKKRTNGLVVVYPGQYETADNIEIVRIFEAVEHLYRDTKELVKKI